MLDYQKIVDDLRSALGWASSESLDVLRLATADYSLACEEANDRLRECGGLLARGLRSEALQKCEVEPNLLDVVVVLDFPERDQLFALTRSYGIAQPPGLSLEVAAELNEAYAVQQPLESLLRRHRLLALARGPLAQRISTLREIAVLDQNNVVWRDDVVEFEKERLKQVQVEAHQAKQRRDLATLDKLSDELCNDAWQQQPPGQLLRSVQRAADSLRKGDAKTELTQLEVQLNEAFAALDVDAARRLRDRWNACAATCRLAEDDPLAQRAEPALAWLHEQDERDQHEADYQSALVGLEHALDRDSRLEYLEKLRAAAVRHGHDLPTYLANRYRSRVDALRLAGRRRHRLILAGGAAALLLLAGTIGTVIWQQIQRRESAAAQAALRDLIDQGKLDAATRI